MFSYEFSLEPENLLPQNRCFVRGFRQFSSHLTKCHACHRICTLSPLDGSPANAIRKNTQHDTSKVLRLPACLPACLPHKTTFDTLPNTSECHEVPHLPRQTKQRHMWNLQKLKVTPFAELTIGTAIRGSRGRLRTVADGWANPLNPRPPEWNGNPCYAFGKKLMLWMVNEESLVFACGLIISLNSGQRYRLIRTIWLESELSN